MTKREKLALGAAVTYIAIMGVGMMTLTARGFNYEHPDMVRVIVYFEAIMSVVALAAYIATKQAQIKNQSAADQSDADYQRDLAVYKAQEALYQLQLKRYNAEQEKFAEAQAAYKKEMEQYEASYDEDALAKYQAEQAEYEKKLAAYNEEMAKYKDQLAAYLKGQDGADGKQASANDIAIRQFLENSIASGNLKDASTIYKDHPEFLDSLLKAATSYHIFTNSFTEAGGHINGGVAAKVLEKLNGAIGINGVENVIDNYVAAVLKSQGMDATATDATTIAAKEAAKKHFFDAFYFQTVAQLDTNASLSDTNAVLHLGSDVDTDQFKFDDKFHTVIKDAAGEQFIDFDSEFAYYKELADFLTTLPQSEGVTFTEDEQNQTTIIDVSNTDDEYVIVNLSKEYLTNYHKLTFTGLTDGTDGRTNRAVIINVTGIGTDGTVNVQNGNLTYQYMSGDINFHPGEQQSFGAATVLWNFGNATKIATENSHLAGQILAPSADVTIDGGTSLDGNIIVDKLVDYQETHRWDFQGVTPPTKPVAPTAPEKPTIPPLPKEPEQPKLTKPTEPTPPTKPDQTVTPGALIKPVAPTLNLQPTTRVPGTPDEPKEPAKPQLPKLALPDRPTPPTEPSKPQHNGELPTPPTPPTKPELTVEKPTAPTPPDKPEFEFTTVPNKPSRPTPPTPPTFPKVPTTKRPTMPTPPTMPDFPTPPTPGETTPPTPGEDVPPTPGEDVPPLPPLTPGEPEEPDWPELPDTYGDEPHDDQPSDDEDWPELPDTYGEEEEDYPELPDTYGEETETPTPVKTSTQIETTSVSENVLPQTGNKANRNASVFGMILAALSSLGLFGMARRKQD